MKKLIIMIGLLICSSIYSIDVPAEFVIKHKEKLKEITERNINKYPKNYYMQKRVSEEDFASFYEMYQIKEKLGISND